MACGSYDLRPLILRKGLCPALGRIIGWSDDDDEDTPYPLVIEVEDAVRNVKGLLVFLQDLNWHG